MHFPSSYIIVHRAGDTLVGEVVWRGGKQRDGQLPLFSLCVCAHQGDCMHQCDVITTSEYRIYDWRWYLQLLLSYIQMCAYVGFVPWARAPHWALVIFGIFTLFRSKRLTFWLISGTFKFLSLGHFHLQSTLRGNPWTIQVLLCPM